jgi:signal transduction histidine kinase/DNA-binding response OmpR family regulator
MEILLVEDKSVDRLLALEALEEIGFEGTTHSVCDGEEAVSFLRRRGKHANSPRPQLVLLDLNLPGKTGHDVLKEIKTDVNLMDIPVVVFTSSVSDDDINRAYDERANCYVRKPNDFRGYRDVVRNIQRFWGGVALPQRLTATGTTSQPSSAMLDGDADDAATIRVLLVEDSATDVLMLEAELADDAGAPFHVTDVPRLADAMALLATDEFDVVLTDLGLPDSAGLETFVSINKAAHGLPVIVMTGLNDEAMGISAMRAGAQDYFVKGHLQHGLPRAIRYAIERRRTGETLRRSEERFRASLESLLDGFALLSVVPGTDGAAIGEFRIDYINECGRRQQLANGSEPSLTSLFPEARATRLFDELVEVAETGRSFTRESVLLSAEQVCAGGPSFDFRAVKFGEGIALSWRDATERLKLEAQVLQSQKMTSIGQLAGGIAHDFNNLLTVIHGHADVLAASTSLPGALTESIAGISDAATRATNLTRQLLTFSRQHPMVAVEIDMNETVSQMSNMLSRILGEDITLQLHFRQPAPYVLGDRSMIEQVLLNLAVNARDAMPSGGKLVVTTSVRNVGDAELELEPDVTAGRFVCLSVNDDGCGIARDLMGKIFEPFFTTKDFGKGTGLGLATVYGIAKQHKGYIRVESEPERGTTFEVFLPYVVHAPSAEEMPVPHTHEGKKGDATILFVEDEAAIREMATMYLEGNGYHVIEASNGREAVALWEKHRNEIDLVLTDLMMPGGLNGHQLVQRLQADRPDLKAIFVSGYSCDLFGDETFLDETTDFLQKPYRLKNLADMVHDCLARDPAE